MKRREICPIGALLEPRLAILRERSRVWDTGCARLRAIEEQLAIVVEWIRLAHEDALALRDREPLGLRVEEEVDAQMLALGRQPH